MRLFTANDTVQLPPAGSVPAVSAKEVALAAMVVGVKPVQPVPALVTVPPVATRFAGKLSLKVVPVSACAALGLVMVKVSVELPLTGTDAGKKALMMVGRASNVALAAAVLVTFKLLVKAPAGMVLVKLAALEAMTLTEKVQVVLAGTVPEIKAKVVAPAAMVVGVKPVQLPPATVMAPPAAESPEGNESVNAAPVSAIGLLLATMTSSCAVPPALTLTGLTPLLRARSE